MLSDFSERPAAAGMLFNFFLFCSLLFSLLDGAFRASL